MELEETFPCDICKVSFITRQERNKHIESHFTRHECQHCSKSLILIGNHFYELHSTVNCIRTFDGHLENLAYDESKCITEKSILRESKGLENDSINNILKNETRNSARISLQIGTTQDDQGFSTDVEGVTEAQEVERKRKKRTKRKATKRRKQILEKSLESNDSFEAKQDECQVSAKDLANDSSAAINLGEDTANDVEDDSGEEAHSPPGYVTSNVPAGFANKVFNMYKPINKRLQSKIPCDECNKLFRTNRTLMSHKKNIHQRNTSANRTASCDECGRAFSNVGNLNKHKLIHQDTKRFICSYCGKGFNGYFNLTEHMNIHTGLKPYPCQVCSKTFGRATHLVVSYPFD